MRILIWFHRDLRTHDHAGLNWALAQGHEVMGVTFCPSGNSSSFKLKFWNETAENLALNLKTAGIPLEISNECALSKIPSMVSIHQVDKVLTHRRMNYRDQQELKAVANKLSIEMVEMGELTLYESNIADKLIIDDLKPFTRFKNYLVANFSVPSSDPRPKEIQLIDPGYLNWSDGGESAGMIRLHEYVWKSRACLHYHETRNGMIECNDSSKFSRWLAFGALSPRLIFQELKRLEIEVGPCPGIDALIYELIWRDYFKFLAYVMKEAFFSIQGLKLSPLNIVDDNHLFESWKKGETGEDFVDANMRELFLTGHMSNRGRQNVASYLAKKMKLDWMLGAAWFEEQLIDEDPENNWGNWQYVAGVGTDPRDRIFDMKKQSQMYDPERLYQTKWLGEVWDLEKKMIELLNRRSLDATICPSEILHSHDKKNKKMMEEVRSAARRLHNKGVIDFFQRGQRVDPYRVSGPIRIKLRV